MAKQKFLVVCSNPEDDDELTIPCDDMASALDEARAKIMFSDDYEEMAITDPKGEVILDHEEICKKLGIQITEFTTDICTFINALC